MERSEWQCARIDGVELAYQEQGSGEPVVLVHGAMAGAFLPLVAQPMLRERYRLIAYQQRGFGASPAPEAPLSIAEHAADCRALMRHLGLERAHVVGHSSGALIVLQLALDDPEAVGTLALLEPAWPEIMFTTPEIGAAFNKAMPLYQGGDKAGALDAFMQGFLGPDYRADLERHLPPEALAHAGDDVDTLFSRMVPALQSWQFTREDAARITQPVLAVAGAESIPMFRRVHDQLQAWLPQAEPFVLPQATHLLMVMNPRAMAAALADFLMRHPLRTAT